MLVPFVERHSLAAVRFWLFSQQLRAETTLHENTRSDRGIPEEVQRTQFMVLRLIVVAELRAGRDIWIAASWNDMALRMEEERASDHLP